jgi:hypothetical protein
MNHKSFYPSFLLAGALVIGLFLAIFQTASATHQAVGILAMPSESAGATLSLAKVYSEPDDASQLLELFPPGKQMSILGLDESGYYVGISKLGQSNLGGWMSRSDVKYNLVQAKATRLARVFQQPNVDSAVIFALSPGQTVSAVGQSAEDQSMIAVNFLSGGKTALGWVMADDLSLP